LFYCGFNKRWYIVYQRNLQHNNYSFVHPTYTLLPLYLGKNMNCAIVTLTNKFTHHCCTNEKSIQFICTSIAVSVQNGLPFHPLRPEVSYAMHQWHHSQCFARSHSKCQPGIVSDQPCLVLIHTILHHAPYVIINRTMIEAIGSHKSRLNNFTVSVTQLSDVHNVLAHIVLLEDVSVTTATAPVNDSISCISTIS